MPTAKENHLKSTRHINIITNSIQNMWICQPELNCNSKELMFLLLKLCFHLLNYLVLLCNNFLTTNSLSVQLYFKLTVSCNNYNKRYFPRYSTHLFAIHWLQMSVWT
jgi:hypothetical protein